MQHTDGQNTVSFDRWMDGWTDGRMDGQTEYTAAVQHSTSSLSASVSNLKRRIIINLSHSFRHFVTFSLVFKCVHQERISKRRRVRRSVSPSVGLSIHPYVRYTSLKIIVFGTFQLRRCFKSPFRYSVL